LWTRFCNEVQLEIHLDLLPLTVRGSGRLPADLFLWGFPYPRKRLRAPNSCGIGKQPLDRKVGAAMRFSFELFNEQVVRP
jgi:hypothetical protein